MFLLFRKRFSLEKKDIRASSVVHYEIPYRIKIVDFSESVMIRIPKQEERTDWIVPISKKLNVRERPKSAGIAAKLLALPSEERYFWCLIQDKGEEESKQEENRFDLPLRRCLLVLLERMKAKALKSGEPAPKMVDTPPKISTPKTVSASSSLKRKLSVDFPTDVLSSESLSVSLLPYLEKLYFPASKEQHAPMLAADLSQEVLLWRSSLH